MIIDKYWNENYSKIWNINDEDEYFEKAINLLCNTDNLDEGVLSSFVARVISNSENKTIKKVDKLKSTFPFF